MAALTAGFLVFAQGCGSTTQTSSSTSEPITAGTSTTTQRIDGPTLVAAFPTGAGVDASVLSGTAASILTSNDGGDLSIWQTAPGSSGSTVVRPGELNEFNPSTVSLAAWPSGFIVMGERCDDHPQVAECIKDSGLVKRFDRSGKFVAESTLWRDRPTEAGGSAPTFIGLHGNNAWLQGLDGIVEINPAGKTAAKVQRPAQTQACTKEGTLYAVAMKQPELQTTKPDGSPRPFTADDLKKLPPASISMQRWSGTAWDAVSNGTLADAGSATDLHCQGDSLTLWDSTAVVATWTPKAGWVKPPKPSEPLHQSTNVSGQLSPTFASNGAIYRLGDDFHLRRLDIPTGAFVDTSLKLEPTTTNTKAFITLTVAEDGPNLFACAERATGLPNGPTSPGTICGFAPVPS